jgi:hypothetical protein
LSRKRAASDGSDADCALLATSLSSSCQRLLATVAFRPDSDGAASYRLPDSAQKIAVSVVILIVVVLADGHLLRAW